MFLGEFHHTVDSKGRVVLPSKFREILADGLIITKGMEKCLFVFSRSEWPHLQDRVQALSLAKRDARQFSRFFFGGATEEELDKQGRVLIPEHLRQYAELNRDVVVVGVSNRAEVWNRENWEAYVKKAESSYAEIAEELTNLGL